MPNMVTNHPLFFLHFFLIFSLFYCYFSFSIATLSIFGSVRWTLNTQCPIWSPTIPNFFPYCFLIFSLFYCYFSLSIATLSIFGSAHQTLKTVLDVVTNSEHHYWAHWRTLHRQHVILAICPVAKCPFWYKMLFGQVSILNASDNSTGWPQYMLLSPGHVQIERWHLQQQTSVVFQPPPSTTINNAQHHPSPTATAHLHQPQTTHSTRGVRTARQHQHCDATSPGQHKVMMMCHII